MLLQKKKTCAEVKVRVPSLLFFFKVQNLKSPRTLTLSNRILQESAKVDETSTSGWVWVGWWYDGICFFSLVAMIFTLEMGILVLVLVLLIGGWCMEAGLWYQAFSDISARRPTSPCRAWPQLGIPKRPNLKLLFKWFSCWVEEKPKQQLGIYISDILKLLFGY